MATEVDLKIGLQLTIGSIPVSLDATFDKQAGKTVYAFDGCIQDADISLGEFIGHVGGQFGVDVELPPELNLSAHIDYIAGQVVHSKSIEGDATTELGISARFELGSFPISFYADMRLVTPKPPGGNPYVIGARMERELKFSDLPLVGRVPDFSEFAITDLGFSYTNSDKGGSFMLPRVVEAYNPLYTRGDPAAADAPKQSKIYTIDRSNAAPLTLQQEGFAVTAALKKGDTPITSFALPLALRKSSTPAEARQKAPEKPAQKAPKPAPFASQATSPADAPVHWIDIHKTFGPVDLQRIGLSYSGGEATFGFSAGFTVGGFSLDVQGLTITFPMPLPRQAAGDTVSFDLQGLVLGMSRGGLTLGGAFLKVKDAQGTTSYFGEIIAHTATFGFTALGGYTPEHGNNPASFFIYAKVDVPLGGPPFLFVTGLAAGFGINRALILPDLQELPGYVLLPKNAPSAGASPADAITDILPKLQSALAEKPGEYWVAAGISFTSFEMVDAFALITVSFGVDMQVGLLGSAAMTFPKGSGSRAIAYAEIDLVASVHPSTGLMSVMGVLSPASSIYGGYCHLAGGFAYCLWFAGDYKGDFVVSMGGYSPFLHDIGHYPSVPRLTIAFGLGPFQATGQAYYALTPAMMMAGMSMSATWSSGPVSAWVDAGIDILLSWAPFHYEAHGYIHIGCSVDLLLFTISLHVGADLYIWGPPFGGMARVDLDVVSFDINFGADREPPPAVGWATFRDGFLPKNTRSDAESKSRAMRARSATRAAAFATSAAAQATDAGAGKVNIITASVEDGLLKHDFDGNGRHFDWILDPEHFVLLTSSTIPANRAEWQYDKKLVPLSDDPAAYNLSSFAEGNGPYLVWSPGQTPYSDTKAWNPSLNIAPMRQKAVNSYHTISLVRHDAEEGDDYVDVLAVEPVLAKSNTALWGEHKDDRKADDPSLVRATLTGFRITPIPRHPRTSRSVPLIVLVFQSGFSTGFAYTAPTIDPRYGVAAAKEGERLSISITGGPASPIVSTDYVLGALLDPWVVAQRNALLDDLAGQFSTAAANDVRLSTFAIKKALVDWPMVELLGADLPSVN